ncbi:MAG TPA: hypothetical protein VF449_04715, partial [Parvibaculum sp.]
MSSDRGRRAGAPWAGVKRGSGLLLALSLLAGCTVVQGDTASLDNMKTAAATPAPAAATANPASNDLLSTGSLADASIASAGIPIPLISPRHLNVRVASIDPRAGLGSLTGGVPIEQLAGVYLHYDDALSVAEASRLNTPKEVRRVLKSLRFSEPETMAEGWYAVRAAAAAQNALFAEGVRNEVRLKGKDFVLASLNEANYVLRLPGAASAVTSVMASVAAENDRMMALKQKFLDTAYKFQKQKWGMTAPLETVKAADAGPSASSSFRAALAELSPVTPAQAYSATVMTKILAQGAREIISAPLTTVAAQNDETSSCLNWAR